MHAGDSFKEKKVSEWRGDAQISGKIVDEAGKGIPEAKVTFIFVKANDGFFATTKKNGEFSAKDIKGGEWRVQVDAANFITVRQPLTIADTKNAPISVTLKRDNSPELLTKAEALFKAGQNAEARTEYLTVLAAHPELKDGTVLILNLEHVAYADVVRGKVRAPNNIGMTWETSVTEAAKAVGVTNESPFLFDLWKQASRCYGVATYQSAGTTVSGDLGGYRPLNVPMTQMIQSGTFYHASGDVLEAVPAEGLERAARFHAFFIEQADQAPESLIAAGKGTPYQSMVKACP